jgi:hypothetical protein
VKLSDGLDNTDSRDGMALEVLHQGLESQDRDTVGAGGHMSDVARRSIMVVLMSEQRRLTFHPSALFSRSDQILIYSGLEVEPPTQI